MQEFSIFLKVSTRHSLIVKSPSTRVVQRKVEGLRSYIDILTLIVKLVRIYLL